MISGWVVRLVGLGVWLFGFGLVIVDWLCWFGLFGCMLLVSISFVDLRHYNGCVCWLLRLFVVVLWVWFDVCVWVLIFGWVLWCLVLRF